MIFLKKESKFKKKFFFVLFFFGGGGGGGRGGWARGVDGRTDGQAQTNLPLQLHRSWGHNKE